jgi:hypothetical protein
MVKTPETEALMTALQTYFGVGTIVTSPKEYWTKHGLNAHDQIRWTVGAQKDVLEVCRKVEPLLKVKRKDCLALIDFCQTNPIRAYTRMPIKPRI